MNKSPSSTKIDYVQYKHTEEEGYKIRNKKVSTCFVDSGVVLRCA